MDKTTAVELSTLFQSAIGDKAGWKIERLSDRSSGTLIAEYEITDKQGMLYNFWLGCWRMDNTSNFYLNVFTKKKSFPLLELHEVEGRTFRWRYKPTKQDGRNAERRKQFAEAAGDLKITIPIPKTASELPAFLETVYGYVALRLASDDLQTPTPLGAVTPQSCKTS